MPTPGTGLLTWGKEEIMEPQFEDDVPEDFEDDAPRGEEVQSIKEVVGSFLVAMKNYGI